MTDHDQDVPNVEASVLELFDGRFQGVVAISAKRDGVLYTSVYSCDPLRTTADDAQSDADAMVEHYASVFEAEHGFGMNAPGEAPPPPQERIEGHHAR